MEAARGRLGVAANGVARDAVNLLMYACQQGHEAEVRQILATKPGAARERDRAKRTALHYCTENSSLNCIDQVLNAEPSLINATDDEGYTPLHLAVINGNRAVVRYLVNKGADLRCLDNEKHSLVHWATVCGELECLSILVESGADASTADIHGAFPVHYAAQMCGPNSELGNDVRTGLQALRRLLEHGVNVNVKDQDGRQPLLWAASAGSSDALLALVNAGASISSQDKDGLTALHCAASRGHNECLETLHTLCGTELDAVDNNGCTALFYAVTLGHADCTEVLLKFGSEANRQDRKGRTPAHCGAAKGQLETLKILAKHGGNLWMKNIRGDLPLHEAVHSGRKDLVKWLLDQKPDAVNATNNDGRTPLHVAALNSNVEMCKVLMDNHAFINPVMRNSKGQLMTPLDAALYRGRGSCAKYLQLSGAVPASKLNERLRGASDLGGSIGNGVDPPSLPGHATGNSTDRDSLTLSENITRYLERNAQQQHNNSNSDHQSNGSPRDHKASQVDLFKDSLRDQGSQTLAAIVGNTHTKSPEESHHPHNNNNGSYHHPEDTHSRDDGNSIEGAPLSRSYAHPLHGGLRHHGPSTGKAVYQQRQMNQQATAAPPGGKSHEQRLPPSENVSPVSGDTFTTHKDSGISHSDRGEYSDLDSDNPYSVEGGRGRGVGAGGSDPAVNTTTASSENNTLTRRRRHRTSRHGLVGRRGVSDSEFDRRRPRKIEGVVVGDGMGKLPAAVAASSADMIGAAVQNNVKRYQRERRIFQVLLELKRQQIRGGKTSELPIVKRLADNYIKEGLPVNHQKFQGPYTYRAFDNYLYEQLRFLSTSGAGSAKSLKNETNKKEASLGLGKDDSEDPLKCTNRTFNCHHAAHAYTGIPCAAFIKPKAQNYSFLPQIFPAGKDGHAFNVRDLNPNEQVTLEIKQPGKEKKAFTLPTDALDKTKRYQVTFTIGAPPPNPYGKGESAKHAEKLKALLLSDATKVK